MRVPQTRVLSARRGFIVSAGGAAMLALAACSTGGTSVSPTSSASSTALITTTGTAKSDVDHVTWNLPEGEPTSLDPTKVWGGNTGLVLSNACEPLLRQNPDYSMSPNLASVSQPDPKTLVYTIKSGITFWDGAPLTAEDAAYSLNRSFKDDSSVAYGYFVNVASVEATGPLTVTVKFKEPDELFNKEVATANFIVIEKKWAESQGANLGTPKGLLMCTGPFKLTSWTPGQSIELTRNEKYWNPAGRAHAASVTLKFVSDSSALAAALSSGSSTALTTCRPRSSRHSRHRPRDISDHGPSLNGWQIYRTFPDGPMADVKLRDALFGCIDRAALATSVFRGAAEPLYTWLQKTIWDPAAIDQWKAAYAPYEKARSTVDVSKCKQSLAESKYKGETLTMMTLGGDDTQSQISQLVQQWAKAVGITVAIKPVTALEYQTAGYDPKARAGTDLYLSTGFDNVADPLEPLLYYVVPGVYSNWINFNEPAVNDAIAKSRASVDPQEQAKLLIGVQEAYEPQNDFGTSLVQAYQVSFLNKRLTGLVTSGAYSNSPTLAGIGAP